MLDAALELRRAPARHVVIVSSGRRSPADAGRAAATSTGTARCAAAARPAELRRRWRRPTRSTSSTPRAPPGSRRASSATTAGTRWRWPGRCPTSTTSAPGEVLWTASDVGWVVGHSYIVYAPLLAGATTVLYEGKPVGTPDAGAFWRVVAEHGVEALFTAPTAIRAIKKEDPDGDAARPSYDLSPLAHAVPGRRAARPRHLPLGDASSSASRSIDHWWQTETGWPIAANLRGLEPMPIKAGLADRARCRATTCAILDERGRAGRRPGAEGAICVRLPLPPGHAADAVGRRRAVRRVVPVGLRRLLPHRRRRVPRRGRLPVRDGPHRRRDQRGRAPAVDRRRWRRCWPRTRRWPSAR